MRSILLLLLTSLLMVACTSRPNGVLSKKEMINLLVEIHKSEAYVQVHNGQFHNDSLKRVMEQSIYERYGVTKEEVDSSLSWYVHHADEYVKIYDGVIAELSDQSVNLHSKNVKENDALMENGDSVNIWESAPVRLLSQKLGLKYVAFDVTSDPTFKRGDLFRLNFHIAGYRDANVMIGVDYVDGSYGYMNRSTHEDGRHSIDFQTDSTKNIKRIYGMMTLTSLNYNEFVYVDSISLVRTRLRPERYHQFYSTRNLRTNEQNAPKRPKSLNGMDSITIMQGSTQVTKID